MYRAEIVLEFLAALVRRMNRMSGSGYSMDEQVSYERARRSAPDVIINTSMQMLWSSLPSPVHKKKDSVQYIRWQIRLTWRSP